MSIPDSMPLPEPKGVDINETRQPEILGWAAAMIVLSFLAVVLRFLSRYLVRNKFQMDDWLALSSLPFAWIMCFIAIYGVENDHFGLHIGRSTWGSIRHYLIGLWVFDMVYGFAITLSKLSIISLWWRIFEVKSCHLILGILTTMEIAWLVATTLVTVFSCTPVEGFWNLAIPSNCIVQSRFWLGAAIPNIVFDVALLILPNFYIARLSINTSQKLGLSFIFMLGTFVTICSCLRLWQLIVYNSTLETDLPWATSTTAIWSLVEGNLSVVCCCLPSMRPILRLLLHGRVDSTDQANSRSRSDYHPSANRTSFINNMRASRISKRSSRAIPLSPNVPMQRLSVGVSKKTEWWESSLATPTSADGYVDEDSWPLPSNAGRIVTPSVNTTIYAGDAPPSRGHDRKPNSRPSSGRFSAKHMSKHSNDKTDLSKRAAKNRSAAWPGWVEGLPKPSPPAASGSKTWLQLDDTSAPGSPSDSPRISKEEERGGRMSMRTQLYTDSAEISDITGSVLSDDIHGVSMYEEETTRSYSDVV